MKRLSTSLLLSFALTPVFASAQDAASTNQVSFQQNTVILSREAVASVNVPVAAAETVSVRADWSKVGDRVDGPISKAKLAKMKVVTNALVDFLKDSCLGAGAYSPTWHGEYFSGKNSPGAQLKFGMTSHFAEQNADLSITANDIQPLLDQIMVNGQHFVTMRVATSAENNIYYYADATGSEGVASQTNEGVSGQMNGGAAGQTKMWLVTADNGQSLFTPVTRKEYLTEAKAELHAMVSSIEAAWKQKVPVRPAVQQEAERKAVIDQLKSMYSGADLDIRERIYLRTYKTDEQFLEENVEKETAAFNATIHLMDSLASHLSVSDLAKPAVVSVVAPDFHGFEDGQTNFMLVRMNDGYFNRALSEEKPQLFLVTWHYDGSNASSAALDRQLTERLNTQVLQGMIGR